MSSLGDIPIGGIPAISAELCRQFDANPSRRMEIFNYNLAASPTPGLSDKAALDREGPQQPR